PKVAKGIRLAETLAAVRAAVQFAKRAGHEQLVLQEVLQQVWGKSEEGARPDVPQRSKA
ncbi:MAG: hypothetical protein ACI9S9_001841, partial [Planctomycetota bacterium]